MSYQNEIILYQFQELFHNHFNKNIEKIEKLWADASNRKIYRLISGYTSCVGVWNENEAENKAFIEFSKAFKKGGFNVPQIYGESLDLKFYILEDLGDFTLFNIRNGLKHNNETVLNYYQLALRDLKSFQHKGLDLINLEDCYETKQFDVQQIKIDEEKFANYYLKNFDEPEKYSHTLTETFAYLNDELMKTDGNFFMFRDFQPRNIMVKNSALYYIDYQSGRKGPLQYDVASFLYSGSIELSAAEREFLLNSYLNDAHYKIDKKKFLSYYNFFVVIRLIQVLGSYGFSYHRKKEQKYLNKIEKALKNMQTLLGKFDNRIIDEFIYKLTERLSY